MKKGLKLVPFALAALMLVGCSSRPIGPQNGNNHIVDENTLSYQEYYDEMYSKHNGSEKAARELILRVAKDEVSAFDTFKEYKGGVEQLVKDRKFDYLDDFYNSTYKKDGFFKEKLLVEDLRNQGFDIKDPTDGNTDGFEETSVDNLLSRLENHPELHEVLKYDYTDYLTKKVEYDVYVQLLKEKYILEEKTKYFEDKRIRKVQYFKFTPASASEAEKIQSEIESLLDAEISKNKNISEEDFEKLAKGEFQKAVNKSGLEKVAKDYEILKKVDKLFDDNLAEEDRLTETEKKEVIDAYNNYTNNGAYTKEHGLELKQIEVYNRLGYNDGFIASDDSTSTLVQTDVDALIKKGNLEDHLVTVKDGEENKTTNILDATGSNSKVFKKDSSYFVVRVEAIDKNTLENGKVEDKINGAAALTKNSTNVKNAVAHYLEKAKVNVHEETLYNYLKDTFGFDTNK